MKLILSNKTRGKWFGVKGLITKRLGCEISTRGETTRAEGLGVCGGGGGGSETSVCMFLLNCF